MGKAKAAAPWTWAEIAALNGTTSQGTFLRTYGARGRAALVAALWLKGNARCPFGPESCRGCPVDYRSPWIKVLEGPCHERAMPVYARMVRKLGRLPEGQ
jgi:hypothetical protein